MSDPAQRPGRPFLYRALKVVGWAVLVGLVTGVLGYVIERLWCRALPDVPLLSSSCASDPVELALIVGAAAALVTLLFSAIATRRGH